MARVAPRVPELSEVLCAACGYVLDGLPQNSMCPECGKPISDSLGNDRLPPVWESAQPSHRFAAFIGTTWQIIVHPAKFYRTLNVRGEVTSARRFARLHWWIAGAMFGISGATHAVWFSSPPMLPDFPGGSWVLFGLMSIVLALASYAALDLITRIAGKLTNWEATYRGYRLPYSIVLRGLYYHAAHYLPVATAALLVVEGYQLLRLFFVSQLPFNSPMIYLYVLSGLVVLCAIYLFQTYWIGMRNMMYANR